MNTSTTRQPALSSATGVGSRRVTIALVVVAVFLYWMALYLYVPTLPTYVQSKTTSLALVGVVLAQYGLWQAVVRLPLGIAADWMGWRKPFIVAGLVLAGLGALTMGRSAGVNGILVGRAITGLAASTWVPLVVSFSSLFPPNEAVRASALLTFVGSVGQMLATSVTGSLNALGGYGLAFSLAAGTAALAILAILPAHEDRRPPQRPSVQGVSRLVSRRDVLVPSLLAAVSQYASWAGTFGFLPILARQLGATGITQSVLVSMNIGVVILGNLAATGVANRLGLRRLVTISFVLMALGLGGAALASSLAIVFVAQFCLGLSQGVGYPVLMGMSIQHVLGGERTTAMGLHQAVYAVGMFGGPWLSGILAQAMGIQPMFGVTACACLVAGVGTARWLVKT